MAKHNPQGRNTFLDVVVYGLLIIGLIIIILPILYVVMTSFAPEKEYLTRGFFILPHHFTLEGYTYLLQNSSFLKAFKNAVEITVIGTFINIAITTLMAYGLSKKFIKGRGFLNFIVVFTLIFSGGMIPTYLVVDSLGLVNTYGALWFSTAIAPFNLIVMRSFFVRLPDELFDSARIDGAGEWRILFTIALPLSKAAIATFTLFYMVYNWNTYFHAILYLHDNNKWPLQVFLKLMLVEGDADFGQQEIQGVNFTHSARMAAILITALPLLCVYPFFQKHFNKGMLLGSMKD
ncbi:carbohydrate ABC transporter permease [Bacillus sp. SD088]|uniref:carbohydrate ABC transporter permease n=1 Tax=Bacillus sp. SD088 TaxID=2782012 RepID=UPI001A95DAE5|nr:carbohydrate ABC transporter permease [Bacillus sp. SD088]MBO0992919.1 carbohydrate ABC transporter permease [Bacillus sp. SD088]